MKDEAFATARHLAVPPLLRPSLLVEKVSVFDDCDKPNPANRKYNNANRDFELIEISIAECPCPKANSVIPRPSTSRVTNTASG
jgi:hypothetical protein